LEARITSEQKQLIHRAAEIEGRSVSDFIVSSAETAAKETIRLHQVLELTSRETEALFQVLENPPEPGVRLHEAARRYREFIGH
jgi:uncharacterized protein (DUF1778 family)